VDLWSNFVARQPLDPLAVRVDTLSAGQRQRLALARVLCQNARIVVLDEPDANLDRAGIALVARLVRELASDRMVAFAAHTPDLLQQADRVIVLAPSARGANTSATSLRTAQAG
jgi:ABC-type bacteriocin/lantibiotic exporter with double-glycine peptidase domain